MEGAAWRRGGRGSPPGGFPDLTAGSRAMGGEGIPLRGESVRVMFRTATAPSLSLRDRAPAGHGDDVAR